MANGHGGRRPGAGRKPGATTQAKRDLMEMAKGSGPAALDVLREIMRDKAAPPAARVSAATAVLDRGYGRPAQSVLVGGDPDAPPVAVLDVSKLSTTALAELYTVLGDEAPDADGG